MLPKAESKPPKPMKKAFVATAESVFVTVAKALNVKNAAKKSAIAPKLALIKKSSQTINVLITATIKSPAAISRTNIIAMTKNAATVNAMMIAKLK